MPKIDAPTVAEHSAQRRVALVDAARDLLATDGPQAVVPAGVAARAGLARSSVYQYFPSTGALLGAAVEDTFRLAAEAMNAAVASRSAPDERIAAYLDAGVDAALAGHLPALSWAGLELPPECLARVVELHVSLLAPLIDALEQLGEKDASGVAGLINGVLSAAAGQIQRGEDPDVVRRRVRAFVLAALA